MEKSKSNNDKMELIVVNFTKSRGSGGKVENLCSLYVSSEQDYSSTYLLLEHDVLLDQSICQGQGVLQWHLLILHTVQQHQLLVLETSQVSTGEDAVASELLLGQVVSQSCLGRVSRNWERMISCWRKMLGWFAGLNQWDWPEYQSDDHVAMIGRAIV